MGSVLEITFAPGGPTEELEALLHACLDDFEPLAIQDDADAGVWRVFFRTQAARHAAGDEILSRFGHRLAAVTRTEAPDEGWAARSQAGLGAVRVGRIVVAPPWDRPAADPALVTVVIEPSMGFGTGHHETTRLCLRLLQDCPLHERRVIDAGTGSGVLAIAAWKLGASAITAVDCDPDALQNARDNAARNGAAGSVVLVEADLSGLDVEPADVILANLTRAVLQRFAARLEGLTRPGGSLIASGFAPGEVSDVERAFARAASEILAEGAWAAARFDF